MPDLPIIPLRPWQQNRLATLAVMLYPDDPQKRTELIRDVLIEKKSRKAG